MILFYLDLTINCLRANIETEALVAVGHTGSYKKGLWEDYFKSNNIEQGNSFPVLACFVPLREAADVNMLQAYLTCSESTQSPDLFNR